MAEKKKFTIKKKPTPNGASSLRIKVPKTKLDLQDSEVTPVSREVKQLKIKPETKAPGLKIKSETSTPGLKIKSETSAPGLKIKSETKAPGLKIKSETSAPGLKIKSETKAPGLKIKSETSAPELKIKSETSAPGLKIKSETSAPGLKIKSSTQSTEASGPKPGHKTQLQPRPIEDPLAHAQTPPENKPPEASKDEPQINQQGPIFPEGSSDDEDKSGTLAPPAAKKAAPLSSIMGEVKAAKVIKKEPVNKVAQAIPTALTGGAIKAAKVISKSPKADPASTTNTTTDAPQSIKVKKPHGIIKDSLGYEYCYVPQGQYFIGVENEVTQVEISFSLARFPVTIKDYLEFIEESNTLLSKDEQNSINKVAPHPNCPATMVSWEDAKNYCRWLRKKTGDYYALPTITEWEAAARGTDGRIYPWGQEEPNYEICCFDDGSLQPQSSCSVDYYTDNVSPFGCEGMVGNIMEWTLDSFDDDRDPHILKGGSWASTREFCNNVTPCMSFPATNRSNFFGLRLLYLTKDMYKTYKEFFSK